MDAYATQNSSSLGCWHVASHWSLTHRTQDKQLKYTCQQTRLKLQIITGGYSNFDHPNNQQNLYEIKLKTALNMVNSDLFATALWASELAYVS
jgi:hypothetical protein